MTLTRYCGVWLAAGLLAAATVGSSAAAEPTDKYWVFLGTYTGGKSKGIYRSEFDAKTGQLSPPELAAEVTNPSFLAIHPTNKFLYAVGEVSNIDGKRAGGVYAFALDTKTGSLTKLNAKDSGGAGPCHLTVDQTGRCVIVANYGGGSSGVLPINDDGSLGEMASFHQHEGKSVNPARQEGPHAHSANIDANNRFVVIADLGLDKLLVFKLDPSAAKMTPNDPPAFRTPPGSGPRHFAFHPNGKFAYTNGELDMTVIALKYDANNGTFTQVNVAPTIPADTPADLRKKSSTAEVLVHPSGRYVFVSNRGYDTIATFKVDETTGAVEPGEHLKGNIKTPRNFNIDPSGRWVLVANQDGDSVVVFEWDNAAGRGKQTDTKIEVGRPVCVKFVPAAK
jgi:6-phosphogluconolactonase